jgi:hypothetical protein
MAAAGVGAGIPAMGCRVDPVAERPADLREAAEPRPMGRGLQEGWRPDPRLIAVLAVAVLAVQALPPGLLVMGPAGPAGCILYQVL